MLTSRREDFLCRCETIDNGGGFMVCVTLTSLQWMALFAFPKFFCQLYTVHGCVNGHYIPVACPTKVRLHVHMLNTIQANCAAMNFYIPPRNVVIDFENSMLSAIRPVLPNASAYCCRFHLGQAWWRHMNRIYLGLNYKDRSSDVAHWLQLFLFGLISTSERSCRCFY